MTWVWAERSLDHRAQLHPILVAVFDRALLRSPFDLAITGSYRTREAHEALPAGASQVPYGKTLHRFLPSRAGHLEPVPINYVDTYRYVLLAGVVWACAQELELADALRWGGDWDRDLDLDEETFRDYAHWEVLEAWADRTPVERPPPASNRAAANPIGPGGALAVSRALEIPNVLELIKPIFVRFLGTSKPLTSMGVYAALILMFGGDIVEMLNTPEAVSLFGAHPGELATAWYTKLVVILGYFGIRRRQGEGATA